MSEYRPHAHPKAGGAAVKDKSILVGKEDLTPKERAEWLRKQSKEVQEQSAEMGQRYDLIQKATRAGLLGWETDVNHYRNGNPYCKCPAVDGHAWGSVAAHNARFEAALKSVEDGQ